MADYRETYSAMTDDQLLNLTLDAETLVPEARAALSVELANRSLGKPEVDDYADHLHRVEMMAAHKKPLAQTVNGFGTKIYGKRDQGSDGSFLTTRWVVFFWIPLIPLRGFRVKYAGPGDASIFPGWSRRYFVLSESGPDLGQVVSIYSFIALFILGTWLLDTFHTPSVIGWSALLLWACIPWALRKAAKKRRLARPRRASP